MLPSQKLPISKKTLQWKKDTIDHYEKLSYSSVSSNRNSNYVKKINYDLYNGVFNKQDLEYVCNPLGLKDEEYPATLQHYDVVTPAFNLLIGEESKRPDNCIVISTSPSDINRKQESLRKKIIEALQAELMSEIDPTTIDPNNPPPTPEQIIKYEKYNISDLVESKSNKLLKYLKKFLNTKEVFKKGWKDALLAGEEIYYTGINNNDVTFRRCNPLNITVVLDGDTDYIDDALAVIEVRLLSIASIMDELGDELSPSDLSKLEAMIRSSYTGYHNLLNSPTFKLENGNVVDTGLSGSYGPYTTGNSRSDLIRVVRVEWKSYKKLFYLEYTDEDGIPQNQIVDESFNLSIFKESFSDATTEEFWIPEAWEGLKIGNEIYTAIRPKPNQRRRMDNPYYCKLGYVGLIYNASNSTSVSLMDRLKAYQYLYNIISYRLELAFAMDKGKKFLMDISQIPRSEGIDVDRWMYYLNSMGIAFINTFEEGNKGSVIGKLPSFNQFQAIDLSMANTIQQYIETLDYIKQQIAFISGVTPQRLGAIENKELVGNVERSVQQSALITEYMFDSHDEVKRRCYIALIECAKIAYKEGKKIQYILDDMGVELLHIEEMELEDSEFGVFISNSTKDNMVVETLKQLTQVALQSDKASLSTIIETIINDNPRDIIRTLQRSEQEAMQAAQEAAKQEKAIEQSKIDNDRFKIEQEALDKQLDRDLKEYEINTNNETKIMVAEISALRGVDGPSDMDNDGIPDPIEVAKLSLQQLELNAKVRDEEEKRNSEKEKYKNELAHKEKELSMKREIENKKIEAIRVQNQSQEKIAKEANEIKKKELKLAEKDQSTKLEIEKIKLAAAKAKAAADQKKQALQLRKAKQSNNKPKK